MNPNTHIYLYAKGHYEHRDVVDDLKKIVGKRCGLDYKYVSIENILNLLLKIVYKHFEETENIQHQFSYFVMNMTTPNLWKINADTTHTIEEIIMLNCLSRIAMVEVTNLDLGDVDPIITKLLAED